MDSTVTCQNPFDKTLFTQRLFLRRLRPSDDKDMFEYTSNPEVARFLSWNAHTEIAQTKKYIDLVISQYDRSDCYVWAIELIEIKKFIGIVRLFDVSMFNKRGELSFIINPGFQGRGFANEAIAAVIDFCFREVGLNRIQAKCAPENHSSEKLMLSLKMEFEGILKQYWMINDSFTDAKVYSILAADHS